MGIYITLLRAVNVGGTGKLPMTELKKICADEGLADVTTYLASGNIVCQSDFSSSEIQMRLERGLRGYLDRHIDVVVKTADEVEDIFEKSPFKGTPRPHSYILFLNEDVQGKDLDEMKGLKDEHVSIGDRAVYVYYPNGMGKSKLSIPQAKVGTMRNMNTVSKLIHLAEKL